MNRLETLTAPLIFAHRGASSHAPENTLAAFTAAVDQGAEAVELDVKLTRDRQVVAFHDATLDRTTDGTGRLSEFTLAELKALDAGGHFNPRFHGERIPTLSEIFERIGSLLYINIELTNYATPLDPLVAETVRLVRRYRQEENVLFSSFNLLNLLRVRRLLPETPVAVLALPGSAGWAARSFIGRWFAPRIVHPHVKDCTPAYVQKERHQGRRIHVWTVNDPQAMANMFHAGVNGIFTDDPRLARQVRERS